jgi:hypothetical protein
MKTLTHLDRQPEQGFRRFNSVQSIDTSVGQLRVGNAGKCAILQESAQHVHEHLHQRLQVKHFCDYRVGGFCRRGGGPSPHSPSEKRNRLPTVDTCWRCHSTFTHADDGRMRRILPQEQHARLSRAVSTRFLCLDANGYEFSSGRPDTPHCSIKCLLHNTTLVARNLA